MEQVIQVAIATPGLKGLARFDADEIVLVEQGKQGTQILRLIVGNPHVIKAMASIAPNAAANAPITNLIYERHDGVRISHDLMVSLIAPFGSKTAHAVAMAHDTMIEEVLEAATS